MSPAKTSVPRIAGVLLAGGALGFVLVFAFLAVRFGYPGVLDRPAAEVLPALVAGGPLLRAVWAIYALLPFSIVATAWLVHGHLGLDPRAEWWTRLAGTVAGLAMAVGLARWPTLQWALGEAWLAGPEHHAGLAARFDTLNLVLGNGVGEFLGEVALGGWFRGVGMALRRGWVGRATLVLAALMLVGSLRNVTRLVQPVTDVTNNLLPVVMIWLGAAWLMGRRGATAGTAGAQSTRR